MKTYTNVGYTSAYNRVHYKLKHCISLGKNSGKDEWMNGKNELFTA